MSTIIGSPNEHASALMDAVGDYIRASEKPDASRDELDGYLWQEVITAKQFFDRARVEPRRANGGGVFMANGSNMHGQSSIDGKRW
jgi:hypothetical protein